MKFVQSFLLLMVVCVLMGMGPGVEGPQATIVDRSGKQTQVENLHFEYAPYIEGQSGEGQMRIELPRLERIQVNPDGRVELSTPTSSMQMQDVQGSFSGLTEFGTYSIRLDNVREIRIQR